MLCTFIKTVIKNCELLKLLYMSDNTYTLRNTCVIRDRHSRTFKVVHSTHDKYSFQFIFTMIY